jgi:hypothetical protein
MFKVGDWVTYVGRHPTSRMPNLIGALGVVASEQLNGGFVSVRWVFADPRAVDLDGIVNHFSENIEPLLREGEVISSLE